MGSPHWSNHSQDCIIWLKPPVQKGAEALQNISNLPKQARRTAWWRILDAGRRYNKTVEDML